MHNARQFQSYQQAEIRLRYYDHHNEFMSSSYFAVFSVTLRVPHPRKHRCCRWNSDLILSRQQAEIKLFSV